MLGNIVYRTRPPGTLTRTLAEHVFSPDRYRKSKWPMSPRAAHRRSDQSDRSRRRKSVALRCCMSCCSAIEPTIRSLIGVAIGLKVKFDCGPGRGSRRCRSSPYIWATRAITEWRTHRSPENVPILRSAGDGARSRFRCSTTKRAGYFGTRITGRGALCAGHARICRMPPPPATAAWACSTITHRL